jgi:hypothetical protein
MIIKVFPGLKKVKRPKKGIKTNVSSHCFIHSPLERARETPPSY